MAEAAVPRRALQVRVTSQPLEPGAAAARLRSDGDGAVCCFTGFVRDSSGGRPVSRLDYEAYEPMAARQLQRIGEVALAASGATAALLEHRTGSLAVGEASVVVAAAAPHRDEAFQACRLLIEAVKTEVPIWKREHGPDGAEWVEGEAGGGGGQLSHLGADGAARMVDVSAKPVTERTAVAAGWVRCDAATAALIQAGQLAKGEVLGAARLAGIMAAKRTAELIPLCHPLPLTHVAVELAVDRRLPGVRIRSTVSCAGRTGVEMEALTAVTVAALTVIDMAKSADPWMILEGVGLLSKRGGRSGGLRRPSPAAPQPAGGEPGGISEELG